MIDNKVSVNVSQYEVRELDTFDLVIRNHFTLTGTERDDSNLSFFHGSFVPPEHYSYSSVGYIEEAGSGMKHRLGSRVVYRPQFSKYVHLSLEENRLKDLIFLSDDIDLVDATFIPILCVALSAYYDIKDHEVETVNLWGYGLLGNILLRLLSRDEEYRVNVFMDEVESFVRNNELSDQKYMGQVHFRGLSEMLNKLDENQALVLLDSTLLPERTYEKMKMNPLCMFMDLSRFAANDVRTCLKHDNIQEVYQLLRQQEIHLKDLIAQHVHAEHVEDIISQTKRGFFKGKTIVYDW